MDNQVPAGKASRCEHCGSIISDRYIVLYLELLETLWRVFLWCKQKKIHEFHRKDIKHLFKSENDTARFGDLVLFGGLVYKPGKRGLYGLNMERCELFFDNHYAIPVMITKNPITSEVKVVKQRNLSAIPRLAAFLDKDDIYLAMYKPDERGFVQTEIKDFL